MHHGSFVQCLYPLLLPWWVCRQPFWCHHGELAPEIPKPPSRGDGTTSCAERMGIEKWSKLFGELIFWAIKPHVLYKHQKIYEIWFGQNLGFSHEQYREALTKMGFEQGFGWRACSPNWFTNMLKLVTRDWILVDAMKLVQGCSRWSRPLHSLEVLHLFDPFCFGTGSCIGCSSISCSSISVDRRYDNSILPIYPSDPQTANGALTHIPFTIWLWLT
jgi:hypothetical protein